MSDSLKPHGLQPARLLCPWGSPSKNKGLLSPAPGDLPDPGIKPDSLVAPALQADSLLLNQWGSPLLAVQAYKLME